MAVLVLAKKSVQVSGVRIQKTDVRRQKTDPKFEN